jgi:hypothetical protein
MNVGEFLNSIAILAGLPEDSAPLKMILSDGTLTKIEVPKDFQDMFTEKYKNMVTIESAKHNPDLKRHFTQAALAGIDTTIDRLAKEDFSMDDDYIATLRKHESTGKRLTEFAKKIKELTDKKSAAPDDSDKHKKLTEEIRSLNQQIVEQKSKFDKEKVDIEATYIGHNRERVLNDLFQQFEYTESLPKQVQTDVARSIFNTKLKENNYKVAFDDKGNNPRLLTDQDTEVFISNKPVSINNYLETILAENKLLKVSNGKPAEPAQGKGPLIVKPNNPQQTLNTTAFMAAMESAAIDAARVM